MKTGKPRIVKHRYLENGDLAYYDSKTRTIHILTKDALFRRVLKHELAHSSSRWLFLNESFKTPPIMLLAFTFAGAALATSIFSLEVWRTFGPLGTFLIATVMLLALSQVAYWGEEMRADRVAKTSKLRKRGRLLTLEENRQTAHPPRSQKQGSLALQPEPSPAG